MATTRVQDGQEVYILEHRLARIAKRKHPYDMRNRVTCLMDLMSRERNNSVYSVVTHITTRWTGRITVVAPDGTRYAAHHTDVFRT